MNIYCDAFHCECTYKRKLRQKKNNNNKIYKCRRQKNIFKDENNKIKKKKQANRN